MKRRTLKRLADGNRVIVTDDVGVPFCRPTRASFATDADYVRAVHEHNDRVTACANEAFDGAFRRSLKSKEGV